ncbi:DNA-binding protein [Methylobacterium sp. NFXW15]|uniref:DNA-binding protein n=1 Tax=Methylobacterium sp. NFXW15 TaxID=2819512 RepID=UPI003CF5E306
MPTKEEVFRVADELWAAGQRPSRRNIQERLINGGSPRDILAHLDAWRDERAYKADLGIKDVPERIRVKLAEFAKDAWKTAQVEAAYAWQHERDALQTIRRDEAEDRENLLGQLDEAQATVNGLVARLAAAEEEAKRLQLALDKTSKLLSDARAEAFWDRVMQEVHSLLPPEGSITAEEILAQLKPWTTRGSSMAKEKLTPSTLKEKMKVRAKYGRYLRVLDDGSVARPAA